MSYQQAYPKESINFNKYALTKFSKLEYTYVFGGGKWRKI